jgi:LacI family transcriptional regulator
MARAAVLLLVRKIRARRVGENEECPHALLDFTLVRRDSDGAPAR